jgi:release factor glutamine methyltransferase
MAESVAGALRAATSVLGNDEARAEAERLLGHALGCDRTWMYTHGDEPLEATARVRFESLVEARRSGLPVAYLLGHAGFWSLSLAVTSDVLIPRADTERLVELALERIPDDAVSRVADLGTGSGALALALALERPLARIVATDASVAALAVAQDNARRLALDNVEFRHGEWLQPMVGERFDLIASNPPYIAVDDPHLDRGDLRHEPRMALVSGADGLDAIRIIARLAPGHLSPGGWLLLEHGWEQGTAVRALLDAAGLRDGFTATDLGGRDRVSGGRRT